MNTTIYKYEIPVEDSFAIRMPRGARVLSVHVQGGRPFVWAEVDPDAFPVHHRFQLRGTGHPLRGSEGRFIGTFLVREGALVFHLYEDDIPETAGA